MRILFPLVSLLLLVHCKDSVEEPDPEPEVLNESTEFRVCNNIVTDCRNGRGAYCLNGFKWGETNPLARSGQVPGPEEPGGLLTFSFQEENGLINTHAQVDLPSKSFDNLAPCAKDEIRKAFSAWEEVASIAFEEVEENSSSNIRLFVADIRQSGIGYPNFPENPCSSFRGNLVIQADLWTSDCNTLHNFFLHEIGHVLGLGHIGTTNIMNADFQVVNSLDGLQTGDIKGITQLYGPKE